MNNIAGLGKHELRHLDQGFVVIDNKYACLAHVVYPLLKLDMYSRLSEPDDSVRMLNSKNGCLFGIEH